MQNEELKDLPEEVRRLAGFLLVVRLGDNLTANSKGTFDGEFWHVQVKIRNGEVIGTLEIPSDRQAHSVYWNPKGFERENLSSPRSQIEPQRVDKDKGEERGANS